MAKRACWRGIPTELSLERFVAAELRIMVLAGAVTVVRSNASETFTAGQHCVVEAGCLHSDIMGPEGAAYIVGRRPVRAA